MVSLNEKLASHQKTLPPKFKNIIELEFKRKLTVKERIKIAGGYNLILRLKVMTEHKPGNIQPSLDLVTTEKL